MWVPISGVRVQAPEVLRPWGAGQPGIIMSCVQDRQESTARSDMAIYFEVGCHSGCWGGDPGVMPCQAPSLQASVLCGGS